MLNNEPRGRILPTLVTLVVLGVLLMTFDVRLEGGGVVGVLRSGTQTLVAPLQKGASYVVNPVADLVDSLSNVAGLREENQALRGENAELLAAIIGIQDQLARLELLEQLYDLETAGDDLGRTVANVIGRPDAFDAALIINKGTSSGIAVGQPVVDTFGYVVGTVKDVTRGSATIVPITASRQGLTVTVGDQIGTLQSQPGSAEMRLEVLDAREPVLAGDRIVTSAVSASYPAGLPVGEVVADAAPSSVDALSTTVAPYVDPDTLRLVVVLAWPPDPISVTEDDLVVPVPETTTTTESGSSTTSGEGG
ncbi:MAG: rod shape-determining protein MreC [Acidimicrobiia bacterium]